MVQYKAIETLHRTGKMFAEGMEYAVLKSNGKEQNILVDKDGNRFAIPVTPDTVKLSANISYTRKDGKISRTQVGETVVFSVGAKYAVTKNAYTTPSGKDTKHVVALWDVTKSGAWYPEYFCGAEDFADFKAVVNAVR